MILITGSEGLIGSALMESLPARGMQVRPFDIRRAPAEDTTNPAALQAALQGVTGIVHLAAVSRVVWAENDPARTHATNVDALDNILKACLRMPSRPWLLFASSREVYGDPARLPASEDTVLAPLNVYGRSKVAGEMLVAEAAAAGMVAQTCRFSNVYGSPRDHKDRVSMAFARAAVSGGEIYVEGGDHIFDFTTVDDAADGALRLIDVLAAGKVLPPIHFTTGVGTSLQQLAEIAVSHARKPLRIAQRPPRNYDASRFTGDPARAAELLGWRAKTLPPDGIAELIGKIEAAGL